MNTLPTALPALLSTLTARLTRGMQTDDRLRTRRTIGKLAVHFFPFVSELGRLAAKAKVSLLEMHCADEELASRCLDACRNADEDALKAQELLDMIPELKVQVDALIASMEAKP
ncbi:hypothetical protein ACFQBQ_02310 [Granulicella cerasi]|uniref:Uncharacterized protein n=1 Tax=Granulicella cerasi TaxID=741063 RepID=A0ABW1Z5M8_9BACT|nr:hypothetical protein [Granulicella cerasi]